MNKDFLLSILKNEINKTMGCTDPGSVAFAVAKTVEILGAIPQRIDINVSPNIYKNGINVGVPNTGKRGLLYSAAVGISLHSYTEKKLDILRFANKKDLVAAQKYLNEGRINISCMENPPNLLYINTKAYFEKDCAGVTLEGDYTNITETFINEKREKHANCFSDVESKLHELVKHPVQDILKIVDTFSLSEIEFLIEYAQINKNTALSGYNSNKLCLSNALCLKNKNLDFPYSASFLAKFYTGSAAEARMIGLALPIISISGSGNHGITSFLGVLSVGETLKSEDLELAKALAISSLITIYIKGILKRLNAFCGCSVAASTGVAAATSYLIGGSFEDMTNAMHSVIGALAGMICDGAKESCAYKLNIAVATAIEYAYYAKENHAFIDKNMGIVSTSVEETFKKLGILNNPGMSETDKWILNIIIDNQNNHGM